MPRAFRWAGAGFAVAVAAWVIRLVLVERASTRRLARTAGTWASPGSWSSPCPRPGTGGTPSDPELRASGPPAPTPAGPGGGPAAPVRTSPAAGGPGPRWVAPLEDGSCPATHPVKAKLRSGIYHVEGTTSYQRTRADRCYASPEEAEGDGFRQPRR